MARRLSLNTVAMPATDTGTASALSAPMALALRVSKFRPSLSAPRMADAKAAAVRSSALRMTLAWLFMVLRVACGGGCVA